MSNLVADTIPGKTSALRNYRPQIEAAIRQMKTDGTSRAEAKTAVRLAVRSRGTGSHDDTDFTWQLYAFIDQLYRGEP